jgi:soluble lytic murein transglycosylase-like protein
MESAEALSSSEALPGTEVLPSSTRIETPSGPFTAPHLELERMIKAPWADLSATARRVLGLTLAGQLLLLGLMLFAGFLLSQRLAGQERAMTAEHKEAETTRQRIETLATEAQMLRAEVTNLRQTVAAHTGEDVLFLKVLLLKPEIDVTLASTIAAEAHKQAQLVQQDPNLILAIMAVESDFNPKITSNMGAVGLMQVMPHWKRVLGIQGDLYEIGTNIKYGLQVLGFYQQMYGDLETALTAYNRGPGPVDFAMIKGKEHRNGYAAKVLAVYERLKKLNVRTASM